MGDWIFEIKMIRALRVQNYGEPYTAIATLTANGDTMYIDSQMTRGIDFNRHDYKTFKQFCQSLEMKQAHYEKMRNGERTPRIVHLTN